MEEIGIVKSLSGLTAKVSVPKKSACEGCTAGTCRPEDQFMEIEAINKAGAKEGDKVKVFVNPAQYMKGSLLVYGLPAVSLVVGAVIGKEVVASVLPNIDPDVLSAVFGFAALVVSFLAVKAWSHSYGRKVEARPVIEEVLSR